MAVKKMANSPSSAAAGKTLKQATSGSQGGFVSTGDEVIIEDFNGGKVIASRRGSKTGSKGWTTELSRAQGAFATEKTSIQHSENVSKAFQVTLLEVGSKTLAQKSSQAANHVLVLLDTGSILFSQKGKQLSVSTSSGWSGKGGGKSFIKSGKIVSVQIGKEVPIFTQNGKVKLVLSQSVI